MLPGAPRNAAATAAGFVTGGGAPSMLVMTSPGASPAVSAGPPANTSTTRYLTPAGRDIDKVGITPDVVVVQPADAHPGEPGRDAQLDRALALFAAR